MWLNPNEHMISTRPNTAMHTYSSKKRDTGDVVPSMISTYDSQRLRTQRITIINSHSLSQRPHSISLSLSDSLYLSLSLSLLAYISLFSVGACDNRHVLQRWHSYGYRDNSQCFHAYKMKRWAQWPRRPCKHTSESTYKKTSLRHTHRHTDTHNICTKPT